MKKFSQIPTNINTEIVSENIFSIDSFDALYQKWIFQGVSVENIIFVAEDLNTFTNEEIIELSKDSGLIKSDNITISREDKFKYIFVNFNFNI